MLDAACGIGIDVASLHRRGFRVVAADASAAMVRRCEERLAQQGTAIPVVRCPWDGLPGRFGSEFDAVLCLGNSLSHAPSTEARRAALAAFAEVLVPGGTLVLDIQDWEVVHAAGRRRDDDPLVVARDGIECRRRFDWRVPDRFEDPLVLEITLSLREGGVERQSSHEMAFCLFTREALLDDLEASGFVGVDLRQDPGDDRYAVTAQVA